MIRQVLLTAVVAIGCTNSGFAGFTYSVNNPSQSSGAGTITNITTTYDPAGQMLTWSYAIEKKGSSFSNGFWLVVNDGPNPKGHKNELAIFYGDTATKRLSVFNYNGVNGPSSYSDSGNTFFGAFENALSVSDSATIRTVSFSLNVASINAANLSVDWTGAQFDEKLGYWFHPVLGAAFGYDGNKKLTSFTVGSQGWSDQSNLVTTSVPEPGSLIIFASALVGGVVMRRRRKTSTAAWSADVC